MQNKLIIALGAAAYGALVSWAVTADHYEQKLKTTRKYYNTYNIYNASSPEPGPWSIDAEDLQGTVKMEAQTNDDLDVRLDSGEIEIVREADGTLRTRNLQGEEGEITASDAENPRGDETSEVDEAGETDDESVVPAGETPEETRNKLQSVIDQYAVSDDSSGQQDVAETGAWMEHEDVLPFVISRATFSSDPDEGDLYEKETLTYYPRYRVLLDEDEETIDDIPKVVGWKNLNRFGDQSEEMDTVYVRNRKLMTDYEVVREEDEDLPLHVKYGMPKDEFETAKASGMVKVRDEDLVD